jgi:hypothetical protein
MTLLEQHQSWCSRRSRSRRGRSVKEPGVPGTPLLRVGVERTAAYDRYHQRSVTLMTLWMLYNLPCDHG